MGKQKGDRGSFKAPSKVDIQENPSSWRGKTVNIHAWWSHREVIGRAWAQCLFGHLGVADLPSYSSLRTARDSMIPNNTLILSLTRVLDGLFKSAILIFTDSIIIIVCIFPLQGLRLLDLTLATCIFSTRYARCSDLLTIQPTWLNSVNHCLRQQGVAKYFEVLYRNGTIMI